MSTHQIDNDVIYINNTNIYTEIQNTIEIFFDLDDDSILINALLED